ncbi:hypothetical protein [Amycolatopsis mediterranei]|uniref:Uncharacterized protein n=1 Tax=Amycolatopsis mediterranei (strain S699) TaxID=713604 RepID=A0A9R0P6W5_AMYMS|nr:hypothetical protein [Amycolatopsis mediterranei]AEK47342.1 hypothetical protein RAM_44375 [Amycolatopsis mediterranei S699]KDO08273.1 hypothetical protein DV26_24280 [Amycolatopsis mediterranei]KDU93697.1 hypothetical protein DV36_06495 [Amycolatopsis mediterranei]UZF75324.1 hypothetical protein ISP_008908 [Amycolatopsis mediterranei]
MVERIRQGKRRYIVHLPADQRGQARKPGFPVWDTSLRRVRSRYPRAVEIWRANEDRPQLRRRPAQAGRLVRHGAAAVWRWIRNRDAKPW